MIEGSRVKLTVNRDNNLTLEQNYKRLGLSTKLNAGALGPMKIKGRSIYSTANSTGDSLAISANNLRAIVTPQEVRIERDPETGEILRIVDADEQQATANSLDDPLNELSDEDEDVQTTPELKNHVIAQLEAQAAKEAEIEAKRKKSRHQSQGEQHWLVRLVEVYGEDTAAMARDRKLNPMQQSEGDIKRRLKKMMKQQQED